MFKNLGHLVEVCFYTWVVFDMSRASEKAFRDASQANQKLKSLADMDQEELELKRAPENYRYDRNVGILGGCGFAIVAAAAGFCVYHSGKTLVT
jgi:hypothetical protein